MCRRGKKLGKYFTWRKYNQFNAFDKFQPATFEHAIIFNEFYRLA